jgi:hypothetical protein
VLAARRRGAALHRLLYCNCTVIVALRALRTGRDQTHFFFAAARSIAMSGKRPTDHLEPAAKKRGSERQLTKDDHAEDEEEVRRATLLLHALLGLGLHRRLTPRNARSPRPKAAGGRGHLPARHRRRPARPQDRQGAARPRGGGRQPLRQRAARRLRGAPARGSLQPLCRHLLGRACRRRRRGAARRRACAGPARSRSRRGGSRPGRRRGCCRRGGASRCRGRAGGARPGARGPGRGQAGSRRRVWRLFQRLRWRLRRRGRRARLWRRQRRRVWRRCRWRLRLAR